MLPLVCAQSNLNHKKMRQGSLSLCSGRKDKNNIQFNLATELLHIQDVSVQWAEMLTDVNPEQSLTLVGFISS